MPEKPSFAPTERDALTIYRMLQLAYCTRDQMRRHVYGEGESANVSMSRRWSAMVKLDFVKEKSGLFYPTALGVREVLMPVLAEDPEALWMVDRDHLPRPPNPGNAQLSVDHHRTTAETVLYFIDRYERLPLVTHCYALRAQKLWGGRIRPDAVILLVYERGFSVFLVEAEISNTNEDFAQKVRQYLRYQASGGWRTDCADQFQAPYGLPECADPLFRTMVVCTDARRMGVLMEAANRAQEDGRREAPDADLLRFTTAEEILHRERPRPIWVRPGDREAGQERKRWEVE